MGTHARMVEEQTVGQSRARSEHRQRWVACLALSMMSRRIPAHFHARDPGSMSHAKPEVQACPKMRRRKDDAIDRKCLSLEETPARVERCA